MKSAIDKRKLLVVALLIIFRLQHLWLIQGIPHLFLC